MKFGEVSGVGRGMGVLDGVLCVLRERGSFGDFRFHWFELRF